MESDIRNLSPKEQLKHTLKADDPAYRYYKSIFHLTDGMIALSDGDQIIDANRAFLTFFDSLDIDVFAPSFRLYEQFLTIDKYGYVYEGYLNNRWIDTVLSEEKKHYKVGIKGADTIFTFSVSVTRLDQNHEVYVITFSDVTDMMSYKGILEEGLKTSNHEKAQTQYILSQYNQAIDISNLVARCNLNGVMTYVNDSLCKTLQYTPEELIGQHVSILFESNNDVVCQKMAFESVYGGEIWKGVLKNIGKHGTLHYFATSIIPIKNKDDEIIEVLSIRHDITEMVKAKEEAIQTLEAKTKFFDQVSHELRTPLNAILNFTDQALESYDEIAEDEVSKELVKTYLKRAYKNSEQLLGLINSLLDMAKITSGKTEMAMGKHNVIGLLREAYENCYSLTKDLRIDYRFRSDKSFIEILCDPLKFKQIITNLISNALKFTTVGFVEVRIRETDHHYLIEVEDSGIGIPKEKVDLVFEPFQQVRDHGFGTGLGLSISREYALAMGMTLQLRSEEGVGSCFIISVQKIVG
ncbi:MAG: ATP-binding protein [Sulfuricurvum sp.]|uniref:sensor histidine kinase n=1 Tax=Sulfuricurvum sp. TaxID=2025608 RepID=UPI0026220295|nr:ATP-binding protein [Sulfuricurvum sp.]MDD2368412.1 ATP-binding protein [Sulfuricurvum sp.]MDD2949809.1 ATP-binding protein [Sulfuricurvum sp.]MDD5118650.1 ATP-binding protein [Sulfuricurvum sp.]